MDRQNKIDYIEFGVKNIAEAKRFYGEVFGWEFTDYHPTYAGIKGEEKEMGGFFEVDEVKSGSILPIIFSDNLEESLQKVRKAGGKITKEIFTFPGGKRFQFLDPSGNELSVWKETNE